MFIHFGYINTEVFIWILHKCILIIATYKQVINEDCHIYTNEDYILITNTSIQPFRKIVTIFILHTQSIHLCYIVFIRLCYIHYYCSTAFRIASYIMDKLV